MASNDSAPGDERTRRIQTAVAAAITESAVDAIITIDQQGIIQSANPATQTLFGWPESDLVGRNVSMLMPQPDRDQHDGYLRRYCETGEARIIGSGREVVGRRRDGETFPVHLAVSEFRVGPQRFFAGIVRDISDVKLAEQRLASAHRELVQKERLAAIGETLTGLAHESRNALQRSHACLDELALDLGSMPDSLSLVRKVQRALDDLHRLLEEVRNYAAPIVLELRPISPAACEGEIRQLFDDVNGGEKGIQLEINVADDAPEMVSADLHRLRQVMRNILENAIAECQPAGRIRVQIGGKTSDGHKRWCRVTISDSGSGVPEASREQIFEPFFTTRNKGTGLGLAISKRVIDAHGGRLFVEAGELGGARFGFDLPLK